MNDRSRENFDLYELLHPAQALGHPSEVVNDPDLTLNEKRAILASWRPMHVRWKPRRNYVQRHMVPPCVSMTLWRRYERSTSKQTAINIVGFCIDAAYSGKMIVRVRATPARHSSDLRGCDEILEEHMRHRPER